MYMYIYNYTFMNNRKFGEKLQLMQVCGVCRGVIVVGL